MTGTIGIDPLLRLGRDAHRDPWLDRFWLFAACCLLIGTGIGLRDPWPADEPRFALIARDMVATGEWLVPRVAGDIYADKPPLFFWFTAALLKLTGSLRIAFLLPSFLSAIGCVLAVYDLAARLWRRESGLIAALSLVFTAQFVWQARQAQIDATLCFLTTLSLYGLLRHLLLGPRWGWYLVGWAAAGLGVITKGVGFLPLLVLIPFAVMRTLKWPSPIIVDRPWLWALGPFAFLAAIGLWLVPMLIAATDNPALAVYRDEILFRQTLDRYANAWHHRKPFWYFIVEVIPLLWMPLTLLLPWLVPRWLESLKRREASIALLLSWIVLVIAFFSFSDGKRGVYVLPALPAMALASAPHLLELLQRKSIQLALYGLALAIGLAGVGATLTLLIDTSRHQDLVRNYDFDPLVPIAVIAGTVLVLCVLTRPKRGIAAYGATIAAVLLCVSFWINPALNGARSGTTFVRHVERVADPARELGWAAFKEQYLLNSSRPVVHFGHARWREATQETFDAARWLNAGRGRQLILDATAREHCFGAAKAIPLGFANRREWFLIQGRADPKCIDAGRADAAFAYTPLSTQPLTRSRPSAFVPATSASVCCLAAHSDGTVPRRRAGR